MKHQKLPTTGVETRKLRHKTDQLDGIGNKLRPFVVIENEWPGTERRIRLIRQILQPVLGYAIKKRSLAVFSDELIFPRELTARRRAGRIQRFTTTIAGTLIYFLRRLDLDRSQAIRDIVCFTPEYLRIEAADLRIADYRVDEPVVGVTGGKRSAMQQVKLRPGQIGFPASSVLLSTAQKKCGIE